MILVARHGSRLGQTVADIQALGLTALPCPLMETTPTPAVLDKTIKGVIITSPSALPALPPTAKPIHCVGMRTAHEVQNLGFTVGITGRGGAAALVEEIIQTQAPCPLAHFAGDTASSTWYAKLNAAGFGVERIQAYTTHYLEKLPPDVVWQLRRNAVSSIMLFSPAGAHLMVKLMEAENIKTTAFTALCISPAVAKIWPGKTLVAERPLGDKMLTLLK